MKPLLSSACAIAVVAGLGACAGGEGGEGGRAADAERVGFPPTRPVAAALPAIGAPDAGELRSMTVRSLLDGSTAHIALQPEGERIRIDDGRGCVATRSRDWFSPSESYTGCGSSAGWSTATGEVRVIDSLYPLELGRTGRYLRRLVSSAGEVSTRETDCAVIDKAAVVRPGRPETATWVVRCDDGRVVRTTWYAPGTGPVAYREEHKTRGVREAWLRAD